MWLTIQDFPDYMISDDGMVMSTRLRHDRKTETNSTGKIMTGFHDTRGYHSVMLRKPGSPKPYRRSVHRLVAEAFLENEHNLSDVAHNDGNPSNNSKNNLRWSTHVDNQMDMRKHGTMQDGEKSCTCKITAEIALEIREKAKAIGRGAGVLLCLEYGLSKGQISKIINGKRWKHLS
ncbi:NUMOD4 motif protein [compost metagenome]